MEILNKNSVVTPITNETSLKSKMSEDATKQNSVTNLYNQKIEEKDNSYKLLDNKKNNEISELNQTNELTKINDDIKKKINLGKSDSINTDANNIEKRKDLISPIQDAFKEIQNLNKLINSNDVNQNEIDKLNEKYGSNINKSNIKESLNELKDKISDNTVKEIQSQYNVEKAGFSSVSDFKKNILPLMGNISSVYNNIGNYDKQMISNLLK